MFKTNLLTYLTIAMICTMFILNQNENFARAKCSKIKCDDICFKYGYLENGTTTMIWASALEETVDVSIASLVTLSAH